MTTEEKILWVLGFWIIVILFIFGFATSFIKTLNIFLALGSIFLFVLVLYALDNLNEKEKRK